ncbi:MAG: TlpA disulfide reductase family protein [Bacteroidota bacterium]|nr:TlpA disulfide reductase family protein [Bacteroidota bacterium]
MKTFLALCILLLGPACCRAQSGDAEFNRILKAAIERNDRTRTMKLSVATRMCLAGSTDTAVSNYYIVMQRAPDLGIGFQLYSFTTGGLYTLYDGVRLLKGYPETGRMTEYRKGSIPRQELLRDLAQWDLLPRPASDHVLTTMTEDWTIKKKAVRYDVSGEDSVIILAVDRYGRGQVTGSHLECHLRTFDLLPIRCVSRLDIEILGQQYSDVTISHAAVDAEVEQGLFTGATLPEDVMFYPPPVKPETPPPLQPGVTAPDFTAATVRGDTMRLSDLRGNVVLLDFFYSTCGPCMSAIPKLVALHEEFADRNVVILGVDPFETPETKTLQRLIEKRGVSYAVTFPPQEILFDYKVSGFPTLIILGRDGVIRSTHEGYSEEDSLSDWRREIEAALGE